jgi:lipoyl(octanoyl) transferase
VNNARPLPAAEPPVLIRSLGLTDYRQTLEAMRRHTADRIARRRPGQGRAVESGVAGDGARADHADSPADGAPDEIWLTEHPPVFTLGRDGNRVHVHAPGDIPIVETERGGQVTYHGPGQAVAYLMIDLRRRRLGVRDFVCRVEAGVIACLAAYGIRGVRRPGAPGIYVTRPASRGGFAKIASIGLKISYGCSYHGVAVNGRMNLEPFSRIDPCGFPDLEMTDVATEAELGDIAAVSGKAGAHFQFDFPRFSEQLGAALADALGDGEACTPLR